MRCMLIWRLNFFVEVMELIEFSFGKKILFLKYVKVFENIDEDEFFNILVLELNVFSLLFDMVMR